MSKYINADQFERDCMFDRECEDMQDVIYKLRDYPAADVRENKHGEWIKVTNGRGGHECSLCGSYAPSYQSGAENLSDFCPNCGADMRGEIE